MLKSQSQRYKKLGFKPQRENVYNKLLPYSEKLDEESTKLYYDIKTNLIKSVLAREMRPGCALWTSRLNKYLKIYGLKFSKEDHIGFIKLFYNLLIIPDLEPSRINKCIFTLTQLLKKKYLISRDELQLEWRPLYDLHFRIAEKSKSGLGMYRCFSNLESSLINLIRSARIYFPASVTQEILDEFRPKLCPFNLADMSYAIDYLGIYLPICVKPEEADISYKLWFGEFMSLFDNCHIPDSWENSMLWLMARLSNYTMGYIDWEPYIPMMFSRFMRCLYLPVLYRQRQIGKSHKIDINAVAIWIICNLNGDKNSTFIHLEKFMQSLESYYYPANIGRWTNKLRELIKKLCYYFVQRLYCERFKEPTWEPQTPNNYKLTEEDIDRFVNILKPCIEKAMFSRQNSQDISLALSYLASIRPNLIIPMTLDKLYAATDSLTEPHKLTSCMMSVSAVARFMVQGSQSKYPEGITHVYPLLMALLPGIDPNDMRKCMVTFNFMVHFINMIPLIDSSEAGKYYDLTEEEHIVCEASASFEEFVLQFFHRLCLWVESNSLDFVRMEQLASSTNNNKNRTELIAESALISVITAILHQCSPTIFTATLKKVYNFATNRILEIQISGKMIAIICQGFAKLNPKETLKLFIPNLCDKIEQLLDENSNIDKEEYLDAELLYNLKILSEIVDARSELLVYSNRLMIILDRTLHMNSLIGNQLAARMLDVMMSSLTYILPIEYRSCSIPYDTPINEFFPIRYWGKADDINKLNVSWYVPGPDEIKLVEKLLEKYLIPELNKLEQYYEGSKILGREELRRSLKIIISILSAHLVLPVWDEPAIQLVDSVLEPWAFNIMVCGDCVVNMPDGRNVRKVIADTINNVQKKILEVDEGDTKSLQNIVHIYHILLFNKTRVQDFEYHWKNFHAVKKMLEDRLHQKKLHLRHVLVSRVMLQQEFRIESRTCSFTETHKQILLNLFELSVSRYSQTRISAQTKVFSVISYFPYSYTILTDKIMEILKMNSEENHERFKGCLYVLSGPKNTPIVTRHDWYFIKQIWPLLVRSKPSEKPSIVALIDSLNEIINKYFPTIAINLIFTQSSLDAARNLANSRPLCNLNDFKQIELNSEGNLKLKCQKRIDDYNKTMDDLLDACIEGNLHWRYRELAMVCMRSLVHRDIKYNSKAIKYFLKSLIDDSITIRKIALRITIFALIQYKPKFKKIKLKKDLPKIVTPGIRNDNKWLLYNSETIPKKSDDWNELRYIHNNYWGYYTWPNELEIYDCDQPNIDKRILCDEENEFLLFFNDTSNINKLIEYFSLEGKKGKDQFHLFKYILFKEIFKIFEDKLLDKFIPHMERLVTDKQESSQICAAEMISGLIRGTKHWPYVKVNNLWKFLIPLFDTIISNIYNETITDWGVCMGMALGGRDPNRHHWILEFLVDDPLRDQTSFTACGRLHMLTIAVNQQVWRNNEMCNRMLDYFKSHLSHSFQNIRDKIASCLTTIFSKDLVFYRSDSNICKFFTDIMIDLNKLYICSLNNKMDENEQNHILDNNKKEEIIRLFKLISQYIIKATKVNYSTIPEYFNLLPLACVLQNNDVDEELGSICSNLLAVLAQTVTFKDHIPFTLAAMMKVLHCPLWSARVVLAEFMSSFIFHNKPTIISNQEWILEIQNIVLQLLEDTQPEVRTNAGQLLTSLLHCKFVLEPMNLLEKFKEKSRTKIKKNTEQNMIRYRHAGVIGMCAFIGSNPYDVPEYLPDIFGLLVSHLNDRQPIPTTIRKTLGDFKRTHHENWQTHKLQFTEEQLSVLSDLTVPPSYYA